MPKMRAADILLVHPYFLDLERIPHQDLDLYPPVGLLYLASTLRKSGYDVSILDGTFICVEELLEAVATSNTPVVGVTANLITKNEALRVIDAAKGRGATVIAGGPDPSTDATEYFKAGADAVVCGEGEETLREFMNAHGEQLHQPSQPIDGLSFAGDKRPTRVRPLLHELGHLPWPDYSIVDIQHYISFGERTKGVSILPILSARGCPFSCSWCAKPVFGDSFRERDVSEFVDELEDMITRYQPKRVRILDDIFTLRKARIAEIADEIERRNIKIQIECLTRVDLLDREAVGNLKRMGCYRIWCGVESGSQRILDAMNKGITLDQVRDAAAWIHEYGMELACYVMVGYLGETYKEVRDTERLMEEVRPDKLSVSIAYPLPGTEYHSQVKNRIVDATSWRHTNDYRISYARKYPDYYYRSVRRMLLAQWRNRIEHGRLSYISRLWRTMSHNLLQLTTLLLSMAGSNR